MTLLHGATGTVTIRAQDADVVPELPIGDVTIKTIDQIERSMSPINHIVTGTMGIVECDENVIGEMFIGDNTKATIVDQTGEACDVFIKSCNFDVDTGICNFEFEVCQ